MTWVERSRQRCQIMKKSNSMSLFNWFTGKPGTARAVGDDGGGRSLPPRDKQSLPQMQRPVADPTNRSEERKLKRHARREQLYVAVREAMTHSGVLSASYKFKVLSLDQRGDQFLVMMDVDQSTDNQAEKLAGIEAKIILTAKARFEIEVTAVYWRINLSGLLVRKTTAPGRGPTAGKQAESVAANAPQKKSVPRYEPIQDDEVTAFKQALAAASSHGGQQRSSSVEADGKLRSSGARSYTLLTGFEDTEMPESSAAPALSATQYGDLN